MVSKKKDDDLLGGLNEEGSEEVFDLLDEIDEDDDTESWGNPDNLKAGDGVQGKVISRANISPKYVPEDGSPTPRVVIEKSDGERVSVTGYQSVLRNEINQADPQPGDTFAVKYFGTKTGKKDREYHHYKVAVRPGTRTTQPPSNKPPF